jgi:peptide/nickel transport system ATP-binding protein
MAQTVHEQPVKADGAGHGAGTVDDASFAVGLDNVSKSFGRGTPPVLDGINLSVRPGEFVCLLGASGCGKSTLLNLVAGLDKPTIGTITVNGGRPALMFQDHALFPWLKAGKNIELALKLRGVAREQRKAEALKLLELVRLDGAYDKRVHELSGGMRQRVLIAIALACEPRLLIADEPTTALDVTIQAQVLEVLKKLVADTDAALLMITHDLGVVAGLCDSVNVMYSGRIVESATRERLFAQPRHPYTGGLLESIPRLDSPRGVPLTPIPGSPTQVLPWSEGCAFAPRCRNRTDECTSRTPELEPDGDRDLRCFNPLTPAGATPAEATR